MTSLPQQGNLSHLMEAATALAKLTGGVSTASPLTAVQLQQQQQQQQEQQQGNNAAGTLEGDKKAAPAVPILRSANSKEIFPQRLMAMLNDPTLTDIITWLPHGRSFVIIRPDVLTEKVLPKYLPPVDSRSSTKYPSFTRKLNRWGFRQATRGPDTGAFHHALFRRDQPDLCLEMVCQRSRDAKKDNKKSSSSTNNSRLPAKKRHVSMLTKESLDAINNTTPAQTTTATPSVASRPATVSVTDDSQSSQSYNYDDNNNNKVGQQPQQQIATPLMLRKPSQGITSDLALAQRAISQRNEQERLRVAKAMLYYAYLQAIQNGGN